MMKFLLLALLAGCALANVDQEYLTNQHYIYKMLIRPHQKLGDKELYEISQNYKPTQYYQRYNLPQEYIEEYVTYVEERRHVLPRGHHFNIFHDKQREYMIHLYDLLYQAKDWETFLKTACWARERVNEHVFVYAFTTALMHRPDTQGYRIPPMYEIMPSKYVDSTTIHKAYKAQMTQTPEIIRAKWVGGEYNKNYEVAYQREDVALNHQHQMIMKLLPFWRCGLEKQERVRQYQKIENPSYNQERQGELFLYIHQQLVARYNQARISSHLPQIKRINYRQPIEQGYFPHLVHKDGAYYAGRPENMYFRDVAEYTVNRVQDWERRILNAVDSGYVFTQEGQVVKMNETNGVNVLGELIQNCPGTYNPQYYGKLSQGLHVLLGQITDPYFKYNITTGVVEDFQTAARDPAFYRIQKVFNQLYYRYKEQQPAYTREELVYSGVEVEAVKVVSDSKASTPNVLYTYFDDAEIDLRNVVDIPVDVLEQSQEQTLAQSVDVKARVQRLNHDRFKYIITLKADGEKKAVVRIFLAPKKDAYGRYLPFYEQRKLFVEMDKFIVQLKQGENVIRRSSLESSVTVPEIKGFQQLIDEVVAAKNGQNSINIDQFHSKCGIPNNLLLPKGTPEGQKYVVFVMVDEYTGEYYPEFNYDVKEHGEKYPGQRGPYQSGQYQCGLIDNRYPDKKPLGYPLDRPVRFYTKQQFVTPNMKFVDVVIRNIPLEKEMPQPFMKPYDHYNYYDVNNNDYTHDYTH